MNDPLIRISSSRDGNVEKRSYRCPCGKGFVSEEQDYTPGHRDCIAFLHCRHCENFYDIEYSESGLRWWIKAKAQNERGIRAAMNLNNVFYFKNIVDSVYPTEDRDPADIQAIVERVKRSIQIVSDEDFSEIIISCFIPDLYSGMGKKEKLFTKLTELMVGEWWRRMGGSYHLPTKKSGTEDVELIYNNISIVCDAKVFRLGRSQKAPNVKDFLKLASVVLWIHNLEDRYHSQSIQQVIIGGLVTYSSLHEWESDSEVYEECTNPSTPVVMLPYEVLALLLKYRSRFELENFLDLWSYSKNHVLTSRNKANYWGYITDYICNLLGISLKDYSVEMRNYHCLILAAASEYRKIVQNTVDEVKASVFADLSRFDDIDQLREYVADEIVMRDNATALDYLKHIDDFRSYKDE